MNGYQSGNGPPLTFLDESDAAMEYTFDRPAPPLAQHRNVQIQPTPSGQGPINRNDQSLSHWPMYNNDYPQNAYQQHWSISTQSSIFSHASSSDNSILSDYQNRFSSNSADLCWSDIPDLSPNQYHAQAENLLNGYPSTIPLYATTAVPAPALQPNRKRNAVRLPNPEKDYYKTCISREKRARRANTVQRYFCTSCKEPFVEKADWKRHEETYQERPEEFQCDSCDAKYFLDKDFVNHHVQAHKCVPCYANTKCLPFSQRKHVQESRRPRKTRTGWGCGFCYHFSTNWTERCKHIADHFDREGKTMADWHHSCVIYSLLQRPAMLVEWEAILGKVKQPIKSLAWNFHSTGREEGYPDNNKRPRLQDALEFFTLQHDAARLARKAFELAIIKYAHEAAPPVPSKSNNDYHTNHTASLQGFTQDMDPWTKLGGSILIDDLLPTDVAQPEHGTWNDCSTSWLDSLQ